MSFIILQLRRATAAAWTSADPTLAEGEIGYETDTGKYKIGDGTTAWTALAYFNKGGVLTYAALSTLDGNTDISGAELEELTDGSETTLHSHAGGGMTFVNRGSLSGFDFTVSNFTLNSSVRTLDLSAIVPAGATAVLLNVWGKCATAGKEVQFYKYGGSLYNSLMIVAQVSNITSSVRGIIACSSDRKISYRATTSATWADMNVNVCGWFI